MPDHVPRPDDDPPFANQLAQHLPALRAFVRLRTAPRLRQLESHSDLVQSVCREALRAQQDLEFRGEREFRNWLFTLAKRKMTERDRYWRAGKRDLDRQLRGGADQDGETWNPLEFYGTFSTPSLHARAAEETLRIEAAFDQLSEEQREVVSLVRVAGMTHAEAAAVMGRTEESSRQLLRRALLRLSILLDE
ncbi:MAG: sigma-70 family RNA polymerase sigma factor [Planctomycetes bacterium]|nr:sigma-70 family RNA polymerase sigma factor [Planctomycetota bacterium]